MNFNRCTLSAVASLDNQNIYVMGGFDNGPLNTVEKYPFFFYYFRYNIITGNWEVMPNMINKRFMHAAILINK
jgi:hypothetical protein